MERDEKFINPYKLFVGSFIPNWLLRRTEISPGAKLCYARLCQYAGPQGECFPSQQAIASELGISERQIRNYLAELSEFNLIRLHKAGFQGKAVYRFLHNSWMEAAAPQSGKILPPIRQDTSGLIRQDTSGPVLKESTLKESIKRKRINHVDKEASKNKPVNQSLIKKAGQLMHGREEIFSKRPEVLISYFVAAGWDEIFIRGAIKESRGKRAPAAYFVALLGHGWNASDRNLQQAKADMEQQPAPVLAGLIGSVIEKTPVAAGEKGGD
jgi:hypothetical protein